MNRLVISGVIVVAVLLIHYSYVDFRFRHRDGLLWFWLARPASAVHWTARLAIAGAVLAAIATLFLGVPKIMAIIICSLVALHVASLIALEIREGR